MKIFVVCAIAICIISVFIILRLIKNKKIKNMNIVKGNSRLFKEINMLNNEFKFYYISHDIIELSPVLKSKRSLDSLDMYKYVMEQIDNDKRYYKTLFFKVDENIHKYNDYQKKYKQLEEFTTEEEFSKFEGLKIKYKTFVKCEEKLYNDLKLKQPVSEISLNCHATYTSPSGRNHYWRDSNYTYAQLKRMLNDIEQQQEMKRLETEMKVKRAEEKRIKERRLRELDKIEKQLKEREEKLIQQEREFKEATKGHIYSGERNDNDIIKSEEKTQYQLLKDLRKEFENGEITKEEYDKMRKELI